MIQAYLPWLERGVEAIMVLLSIRLFALLLEALWFRAALARRRRQAQRELAVACSATGGEPAQRVRRTLTACRHPLAQFQVWLLDPLRQGDPELKAVHLLEATEAGRTRLAQAIARLATPTGLAATLLTIVPLLQSYAEDPAKNQARLIGGMGLALTFTLAGLLLAILAHLIQALLLEPALADLEHELREALLTRRRREALHDANAQGESEPDHEPCPAPWEIKPRPSGRDRRH